MTKVESDALRREIAAAAGPSAGRVGRWVEDVSSGPQVPWQQVLAGAVRRAVSHTAGRGDYNYRRPSRRAAVSPRVVLPSPHRPVPGVAIVIDTSGSMSAAALAHVLAEFDTILDALQLGEHGVIGIAVDTAATATPARRAADVLLVGGAATDMTLGISVAEELRPKPELCVVFTDGYTPWPDEPVGGMTVVAALCRRRPRLPATNAGVDGPRRMRRRRGDRAVNDMPPTQRSGRLHAMSESATPIPDEVVELVRNARAITVFTGAGMSAESRIATFRGSGDDSLWGRFDPMMLASVDGWEADRALVWVGMPGAWASSAASSPTPVIMH